LRTNSSSQLGCCLDQTQRRAKSDRKETGRRLLCNIEPREPITLSATLRARQALSSLVPGVHLQLPGLVHSTPRSSQFEWTPLFALLQNSKLSVEVPVLRSSDWLVSLSCTYMYIYVCVYTNMHICIYIYTYIHIYIYPVPVPVLYSQP